MSFLPDYRYLALTALLIVVWLSVTLIDPVFFSLKNRSTDLLFRDTVPYGRVILVKVDDNSLNKIGQWPWPRSKIAELIGHLGAASVVGIDISLREPSRFGAEDDLVLAEALKNSPVPIVLPSFYTESQVVYPLEVFISSAWHGFSNVPVDNDGVIRRVYSEREFVPSLSYKVASLHGADEKAALSDPRSAESVPPEDSLAPPNSSAAQGLDEASQMYRIHFHGRNTTYPDVSFIDVLEGVIPEDVFRGRVVLVGVTASGLGTFLNTPFGLMSALEIQANAVDTFVEQTYYTSSRALDAGIIVLMTLLGGCVSLYARRIFHVAGALVGVLALYAASALVLFENRIVVDVFYPPMVMFGTVLIATTYQYAITLRREQTLRRSFDTLNSMVASMAEGVVMVDKERRVVVYNPQVENLLGISSPQTPAFSDIVHALKEYADIERIIDSILREGKIHSFRDARIGDHFFQVVIAPVSSRAAVDGAVILFHDITDEKKIERVREDFTSMLVHELRSPLDVMRKMAEVLAAPPASLKKERHGQYMAQISENATRMLSLVNDLLDVAKMEAGKFELKKESADIRAVLGDRFAFYAPVAGSTRLEHHIDGAVPRALSFDPRRIAQVLNNLLSNAIKFTKPGGRIAADVSLCGARFPKQSKHGASVHWFADSAREPEGVHCVVEIFNSGSTVAREDIPRLFDKFRQFEAATKSAKEGTGLGLAIVRGIVEEHGGVVGAASNAEGTSFLFSIPAEFDKSSAV